MNGVIAIYERRRKSSKVCSWQNELFVNFVAYDNKSICRNAIHIMYIYILRNRLNSTAVKNLPLE